MRAKPSPRMALLIAALWALPAAAARPVSPAGPPPALPEGAFAAAIVREGRAQLEARLLVHPDDLRAGAGAIRVGALFDLAPGWHLYWRNPGESGLAPELRWRLDGAAVGPVAWPAPSRFREGGGEIETFGYSGRVLLASRAETLADVAGPRVARLEAEVLACLRECIPARFALERALVPSGDPASDARERRLFEATAAALPAAPAEAGVELLPVWSPPQVGAGDAFELSLGVVACAGGDACAGADLPAFYPDPPPGLELGVAGVEPHPARSGAWIVRLAGRVGEPAPQGPVRGVLELVDAEGGLRHVEVEVAVPAAGTAPAGAGLLAALGLALLGGVLLNLMPCVLPVLALKVFALTELAGQSRREARLHGLAYTLGVSASMAALAVLVVALRAAGASVGWGFQFQEPLFVAAISALLVVFACNLFGLFEIGSVGALAGLGAGASGWRRSFFEGLLAVALATPCTAPFLGTAVGFAFASSAAVVAAVFAAIGVGLAAPFALASLWPGLARFLPRSGPWMGRLRAGLGFALLAAVVWLVWVFSRGAAAAPVPALLAFLLLVAFASWLYGMLQARGTRWLRQGAALAALGLALAAPGLVRVEAGSAAPGALPDGWRPFAPAAVASELARGRPAFVAFTADWCITCKVNERLVLADPRVGAAFASGDFALLRADWTRRDEGIRRELARFGRAGVPLYLIYRPASPERPELLPELLTVDLVLEALRVSVPRA